MVQDVFYQVLDTLHDVCLQHLFNTLGAAGVGDLAYSMWDSWSDYRPLTFTSIRNRLAAAESGLCPRHTPATALGNF